MTNPIQCVQFTLRTEHDTVTIDGKTYTTPELRAALSAQPQEAIKRYPTDADIEAGWPFRSAPEAAAQPPSAQGEKHPPWCSGGCCNPEDAEPQRLTAEQCNDFRRLPLSFNDMVRAIYSAGLAARTCAGKDSGVEAQVYAPVERVTTAYEQGRFAGLEEQGWQAIESAPRSSERLLVFNQSGRIAIETGHYVHNMMHAASIDEEACYWTHWKPLPPPPVALAQQQEVDRG